MICYTTDEISKSQSVCDALCAIGSCNRDDAPVPEFTRDLLFVAVQKQYHVWRTERNVAKLMKYTQEARATHLTPI